MIAASQPIRLPGGRLDGGYLYGDGEECHAADVIIEDCVGPPLYTGRPTGRMTVDSTHVETVITCLVDIHPHMHPVEVTLHRLEHPRGIA